MNCRSMYQVEDVFGELMRIHIFQFTDLFGCHGEILLLHIFSNYIKKDGKGEKMSKISFSYMNTVLDFQKRVWS